MLVTMSLLSPPHPLLTLLEGRALAEAGRLLMQLPLLRLRATRGQGEPILVLPGFMADDRSTLLLTEFLRSIGYNASGWGLGVNRRRLTEYLPPLKDRMQRLIAADHDAAQGQQADTTSGKKVRLIGWSRGGIIAREIGREYPHLVDRIITIGTPVKGGLNASSIGRWVQRELGLTPQQMAQLMKTRYQTPINVPIHALYSRSDGIVAWRACIDDTSTHIQHHEIKGSHIGMGSNVEVFKLIPKLLREDS